MKKHDWRSVTMKNLRAGFYMYKCNNCDVSVVSNRDSGPTDLDLDMEDRQLDCNDEIVCRIMCE